MGDVGTHGIDTIDLFELVFPFALYAQCQGKVSTAGFAQNGDRGDSEFGLVVKRPLQPALAIIQAYRKGVVAFLSIRLKETSTK